MEENIAIAVTPTDISPEVESTEIIERSPRVCPLCSSEIRFFFINFNEKMLMCENIKCEFPFGYEDLQFLHFEGDEDMSDVNSTRTKRTHISPVASGSVVSTATWSEIDKINKVYDSEEQLEQRCYDIPSKPEKKKNKNKTNKNEVNLIQKNVEDIKGLNMELMEISDSNKIIKNERWIKNLMTLQRKSGVKLLKPEELKKLKEGGNDIKIDIDPGNSCNMSTIKIQIGEADV